MNADKNSKFIPRWLAPGVRIVVASLSIINQGAAMRANSGTIYKRVYEHGSEQGIAI